MATDLVKQRAHDALAHMVLDDREFVFAHITDVENKARLEGIREGKRVNTRWNALYTIAGIVLSVVGVAIVVSLVVGGVSNNNHRIRYQVLEKACLERVLCECKEELPK